MKLGFLSAIVPDLSFEEVIDLAADYGYDTVEIACWPVGKAERRYAGVTHIDVDTLDEAQVKKIKDYLSKKGVSISGLGYYPNHLDPDPEKSAYTVEHFKKVITAAAKLGINHANTFVGRDKSKDLDSNFARFKEIWPDIVKHAEKEKVKIGIENCPMLFTWDEWPGGNNLASSPANWRRMFEIIPSKNFGLNYDPSHMIWQMMDYIAPIYEFADRIFHAHVKDVKLREDLLDDVGIMATPLEYHTPKLPGLGDVDWGAYFSALTDIGYDGATCVEVEDRAYEESLETRKASLLQSATYCKQFFPKR
ncbi:MAG: TIM barrel protein [Spirochaetes bacterium]|nr:TIM barrel protein [Spirochaetota bacterium]